MARAKRVRVQGNLRVMPIYVPSRTTLHDIKPGSAIVGDWDTFVGRVRLDYEGNVYDSTHLQRYVERVYQAWGRHVENYPTVARMHVQPHEVSIVGEWDPLNKRVVVNPIDMPLLEKWLDMSPVPESELVL